MQEQKLRTNASSDTQKDSQVHSANCSLRCQQLNLWWDFVVSIEYEIQPRIYWAGLIVCVQEEAFAQVNLFLRD